MPDSTCSGLDAAAGPEESALGLPFELAVDAAGLKESLFALLDGRLLDVGCFSWSGVDFLGPPRRAMSVAVSASAAGLEPASVGRVMAWIRPLMISARGVVGAFLLSVDGRDVGGAAGSDAGVAEVEGWAVAAVPGCPFSRPTGCLPNVSSTTYLTRGAFFGLNGAILRGVALGVPPCLMLLISVCSTRI